MTESPYNGSPLDYMPCPPSRLLYTYDSNGISRQTKTFVREELEKAELCIKRRSLAVENSWCIDKLKQPSIGTNHMKVLEILDVLDKHCNDLSDVNETIEKLYKRIFPKIKVFIGNETHVTESSLADLLQDKNGKGASKTDDEPETGQSDPLYTNMKELSDKEIIFLLCDWAVTTKRCGLHRIFYVVFLIRKRQIDWVTLFKSALKSVSLKKVCVFY